MQMGIGIYDEVTREELLETLPGRTQLTVHLAWLVARELIG